MSSPGRPLSPHLQIYRPQITSVLSIVHRLTGVALSAGSAVFVYWLYALSAGPAKYAAAVSILNHWLVLLIVAGWSFAFYYHLANGIRHLFWDAGAGLELRHAYASGWFVVVLPLLATIATWWVVIGGDA